MRRDSRAGVTLMELLIAISLVSLISVGILMAMRVGLNVMEKANNRLMSNRRVTGTQRILEQQIAGLMAVGADCRRGPGAPPVKMPFFQGEPQSMRFVSSYSLQEAWRGYPRILEFQVIPAENNAGVRLVVNETIYSGPVSTGMMCMGPGPPGMGTLFRPIMVGPQSFVLADRLLFCRFAFQAKAPPPQLAVWLPRWADPVLPSAIRVEMAPLEQGLSKLPLLSLTVPVRVNREPLMQYTDQWYVAR